MLENIKTCMEDYGCGDDTEWGNNIISNQAVQGPSGLIGYEGQVDTIPDEQIVQKCKPIAAHAIQLASELSNIWGSEGGEKFEPFYIANHDGWNCESINIEQARKIFGNTLYPKAKIKIESIDNLRPLAEENAWNDDDLEGWNTLLNWFVEYPDFTESACIEVSSSNERMAGGCVFPRLIVGRLSDGSLAGLFGVVVWT